MPPPPPARLLRTKWLGARRAQPNQQTFPTGKMRFCLTSPTERSTLFFRTKTQLVLPLDDLWSVHLAKHKGFVHLKCVYIVCTSSSNNSSKFCVKHVISVSTCIFYDSKMKSLLGVFYRRISPTTRIPRKDDNCTSAFTTRLRVARRFPMRISSLAKLRASNAILHCRASRH